MTDKLEQVDEIIHRLTKLGVSMDAVNPLRDWLRDRADGKPEVVAYFGCWQQSGHYWWEPGREGPRRPQGRRSSLDPIGPWNQVDGQLTPRQTGKQGEASIHHLNGWTAIGIHDYTVDTRGGSNAVFLMDTDVSFDRAMGYAAEFFPQVVERLFKAGSIALVETCPNCEGERAHRGYR